MRLYEETLQVPAAQQHRGMLARISEFVDAHVRASAATPIRLVVTSSDDDFYHCEVGAIAGDLPPGTSGLESIFRFVRRRLAT